MVSGVIKDLTNIGNIAPSDKLVGERSDGTTVRITYNSNLVYSLGGIVYSQADGIAAITATSTASKMLLSGSSAAPTWSTSTIPTSAGSTALKHLKSDGTNYVLTTATISDSPSTAGKILISDGTNWITSTPTFPTAASTSGKRIKSDGTNLVMSTTTMPDAGTSRKVIVGNGTNYVESTETYAAPSTSGNVMQSDGTNWTSATPTGTGIPVLQSNPTLKDSNSATVLTFSAVASAVNNINIGNSSAAGAYPIVSAIGSDTNIGMNFKAKGSGVIQYQSTNSTPFQMISGTNVHTTNITFANTNVTRTVTFPDVDMTVAPLTSPTFVTPTLGAATATSLTFSPTTGGIVGTTTNDNTTAGDVGEEITATGSAVAITTNTQTNVTSISLTAGDWLVYGSVKSNPAAGTTVTEVAAGISSTSATLPTIYTATGTAAATTATGPSAPCVRISIAGTTTIYLVSRIQYAVSTCTVSGTISGRRVR